MGTAPECVGLRPELQSKGNYPSLFFRTAGEVEKNRAFMTYRTCQNIVLIGSFFLLVSIFFLPFLPTLVKEWRTKDRQLPALNTPTVAAATIVKVWAYKKAGLYYCPDSKLYGKVKPGVYMTQEKALEGGYRPAGQDPCR